MSRFQDLAHVVAPKVIAAGADEGRLAAYIAENAPQLLSRFSEIVG